MLYSAEPTINYRSWVSPRRPSRCMYKVEIWDEHRQRFLLVVDYYTPRRKGKRLRSGWWLAMRQPGYVPRLRPQLVLYLGETCPTIELIEQLISLIFLTRTSCESTTTPDEL